MRGRMSSMARDLQTMFRDALELSEGDRATLAGLLIESLEPPRNPVRHRLGARFSRATEIAWTVLFRPLKRAREMGGDRGSPA